MSRTFKSFLKQQKGEFFEYHTGSCEATWQYQQEEIDKLMALLKKVNSYYDEVDHEGMQFIFLQIQAILLWEGLDEVYLKISREEL